MSALLGHCLDYSPARVGLLFIADKKSSELRIAFGVFTKNILFFLYL